MRRVRSICTIDSLGRILIPVAIRRQLSLYKDDNLEISYDENGIMLRKIDKACVFCNSYDDLIEYKEKCVCRSCLDNLNQH